MYRRSVLFLTVVCAMIGVAVLAQQQQLKKQDLLILEWASKASGETPPIAILIEMGAKDEQPSAWAGRANVAGAKVVHREGYRFRKG